MNETDALKLAYGVIIAGYENEKGFADLISDLQAHGLAGVVFFTRNAPNARALANAIERIKSIENTSKTKVSKTLGKRGEKTNFHFLHENKHRFS